MTKQEQIEEMKTLLLETYVEWLDMPATDKKPNLYDMGAKKLYDAGYRKVLLDTENGKAVDVVQYAPWQLIEGYTEREVEKTRKETAKEILSDLYFLHDSVQGINQKTDFYYSIEQLIAEIEIKYGVEVEE